jgi:hypothetical protein
MSDADLPEAPDQGELEKKGLLSRSVGGTSRLKRGQPTSRHSKYER